jgi:predicted phosphoribosyltransferase
MPFENRAEAATLLVGRLSRYRGRNPLILAIPRGAVPMARIIADALDGEVDVVLVRKLRAPGNPELAIGSIDEAGHVALAEHAKDLWITDEYLEREQREQLEVLRTRRERYGTARPAASAAGRVVIVLDDGVATGSTMMAALKAVRARRPAWLVAAMAVAPPETLKRPRPLADEVVCLEAPPVFYAIGSFFRDFAQVSDEDVIAILQAAAAPKSAVKP